MGPHTMPPIKRTGSREAPSVKSKRSDEPKAAAQRKAAVGKAAPSRTASLNRSAFSTSAKVGAPAAQPTVVGATSTADRLLNRIGALFGHDRELDQLSSKVTSLKEKALSDASLTP